MPLHIEKGGVRRSRTASLFCPPALRACAAGTGGHPEYLMPRKHTKSAEVLVQKSLDVTAPQGVK